MAMNKTGGLVEIIKEFICKPKKDRALLINGEWGSGKTFFIMNQLKLKKIEKIYLSLKGINSVEEIADNIIKQIIFKTSMIGSCLGALEEKVF
jgi:ABC-type polar amino acid transport system ATPase subunit